MIRLYPDRESGCFQFHHHLVCDSRTSAPVLCHRTLTKLSRNAGLSILPHAWLVLRRIGGSE